MRLLFVLLLCLKVMGAFSESAPPPGVITVNGGFGVDSLGGRYLYYNQSQAFFICTTNRESYFGDLSAELLYIPRDGDPISTESYYYMSFMHIKLSTEHHNTTIECHISDSEKNLTTVTKVLLQNIETLRKNGNADDVEVIGAEDDLCHFNVNGLKLRHTKITTLANCGGVPRSKYAADEGYRSDYMILNEQEPLSISFLKRDDDVNASRSCMFEGPITKDPQYQLPHFNKYNYEVIYKEEYRTSQLICILYSETAVVKYVLQLAFIPEFRGFEVNGIRNVQKPLSMEHCTPSTKYAMSEEHNIRSGTQLFKQEHLSISFLKRDDDVNASLSCLFEGPITQDPQYRSAYYNIYTFEIFYKKEYNTSKLTCMYYSESVYEKYSLVLSIIDEVPFEGLSTDNIMMSWQNFHHKEKIYIVEYNTNTEWSCHGGENGGWIYFNETEVDCLGRSDRSKIPETCTFNLNNGFNKTTVKCLSNDGTVVFHLIRNIATPTDVTV